MRICRTIQAIWILHLTKSNWILGSAQAGSIAPLGPAGCRTQHRIESYTCKDPIGLWVLLRQNPQPLWVRLVQDPTSLWVLHSGGPNIQLGRALAGPTAIMGPAHGRPQHPNGFTPVGPMGCWVLHQAGPRGISGLVPGRT